MLKIDTFKMKLSMSSRPTKWLYFYVKTRFPIAIALGLLSILSMFFMIESYNIYVHIVIVLVLAFYAFLSSILAWSFFWGLPNTIYFVKRKDIFGINPKDSKRRSNHRMVSTDQIADNSEVHLGDKLHISVENEEFGINDNEKGVIEVNGKTKIYKDIEGIEEIHYKLKLLETMKNEGLLTEVEYSNKRSLLVAKL